MFSQDNSQKLTPILPILSPQPSIIIPSSSPVVYSATSPFSPVVIATANPKNQNVPYVASLNLSYSKPIIAAYQNLNADPKIHKRMAKYIRYKALDNWLHEDLKHLLGYVKVNGNTVSAITKKSEYKDPTNLSNSAIETRINFIEANILTHVTAFNIATRFIQETNTNWYDIPKNDLFVKRFIEKAIKKKFEKLFK